MIYKYVCIILLLIIFTRTVAQESLIQNISEDYLNKLIQAAKINLPKSKAMAIKLQMKEAAIKKAKLDWYNILSLSYLYTPAGSGAVVNNIGQSFLSGYSIGASTSIGNILMKPGAVKGAKVDYELAKLDADDYNLNLETIVKTRYYTYLSQLASLSMRTKNRDLTTLITNDVKYKYERGEEKFETYNKALLAESAASQAVIDGETTYLIAKSNLEEIIGTKLENIK